MGLTRRNPSPYKKGKLGHRCTEGRPRENTGTGRRLRVTETGFGREPPAGTLTLDMRLQGWGAGSFCLSHSAAALGSGWSKQMPRAGWTPSSLVAWPWQVGGPEEGFGHVPLRARGAPRGTPDPPARDTLAAARAHHPYFVAETLQLRPRHLPWISLSEASFLRL